MIHAVNKCESPCKGVMAASEFLVLGVYSTSKGWLTILFSKGAWMLDIGRISMGYGIGLLSYVVPVYIAEITPKHLRGTFTTVNQLMICIGASLTFLFGTMVTWRTLAQIGIIPCLVQFIGLIFTPESPRWLANVGKLEAVEFSLRRLRGNNDDISEEAAEIRVYYTEAVQRLPKAKILDLFQRKYAHSLIVGVGLMVLQQFGCVNGIAFYTSSIFVSAGFSSGNVGTIAIVAVQIPHDNIGCTFNG
ncbi:hypothetical protein MKX01_042640 [Papaver californicum]|nr:hypothetical protein MKX01_042640 [Papaver californicum]